MSVSFVDRLSAHQARRSAMQQQLTERVKSLVDKVPTAGAQAQKGRTKVIGPPAGPKMLVMTNKTPFWNEQSQVYQARD
jgi:hypothetical protein